MPTTRLTILVDNFVRRRHLLAEHGWACWIETPRGRILFDTGQGHALQPNAQALGIPLAAADAIALSHGHYDHTGALAVMLAIAPHARVFGHPAILEGKFGCAPDGTVHDLGLPSGPGAPQQWLAPRLQAVREPTEILPGIWLTGEVPRVTDFEPAEPRFCRDPAGTVHDPILDDQALLLDTAAGVVVVLGCAHAGVINTLRFVQSLRPRAKIAAVLGGTHLGGAPKPRITRTITEFLELDVSRIMPSHCTGPTAQAALAQQAPDRYQLSEVGAVLEFEM